MSMKVSVSYNINYTELNKLASKSGDVNKWMGQLAGKVTKRSKFYLRNNIIYGNPDVSDEILNEVINLTLLGKK